VSVKDNEHYLCRVDFSNLTSKVNSVTQRVDEEVSIPGKKAYANAHRYAKTATLKSEYKSDVGSSRANKANVNSALDDIVKPILLIDGSSRKDIKFHREVVKDVKPKAGTNTVGKFHTNLRLLDPRRRDQVLNKRHLDEIDVSASIKPSAVYNSTPSQLETYLKSRGLNADDIPYAMVLDDEENENLLQVCHEVLYVRVRK
jgi:hypothetical protein